MKTLLALTSQPNLAAELRGLLNPEEYRLVERTDPEEIEPFLKNHLVDAALVDVELAQVQGVWLIEKLRRWAPDCPLVILAGAGPWEWEEEAYLQGAAWVLHKPLRPRLLHLFLERIFNLVPAPAATPVPLPLALPHPAAAPAPPAAPAPSASHALGVLRDFSAVLTHSLCAEAMLKEFLLLLREILGVNRAVIFLRRPFGLFGNPPTPEQSRRLRSACAIGLSPGLLEHFELSFETGIGGYLFRQGRILRARSEEALAEPALQKEFEVLGVEVAIPMLDRENLIGVVGFAGRVTGEPLTNGELELTFHLLEQLGLAVKNIWLHDQLVANHEMLADILRELSSACVVVSSELAILHANKMARTYFCPRGRRNAELEFSDLPPALAGKVFQVLKSGAALAPFKYQPPEEPQVNYQVTILPFHHQASAMPKSALLVVEDHSREEHLQRLEIEAANLRLIKTMADRLAHEIGNALVPLSTHQQLLATRFKHPDFRVSLDVALAGGVKRISRLSNQMRFLAREALESSQHVPLGDLIEEAFVEAQSHQAFPAAELQQDCRELGLVLTGDRAALKHAFAEILLNALQSNPDHPKIQIQGAIQGTRGARSLRLDITDNGPGFAPELLEQGPQPFYTTRTVGLGLGLTVSRRIIETHQGKLQLLSAQPTQAGVVRITLPVEMTDDPAK